MMKKMKSIYLIIFFLLVSDSFCFDKISWDLIAKKEKNEIYVESTEGVNKTIIKKDKISIYENNVLIKETLINTKESLTSILSDVPKFSKLSEIDENSEDLQLTLNYLMLLLINVFKSTSELNRIIEYEKNENMDVIQSIEYRVYLLVNKK